LPPFNDDDFRGQDVRIGLADEAHPLYKIQKVHISGSKRRITLSLNKDWSDAMFLHPGDCIALLLSADRKTITIQKVPTPKFVKDAFLIAAEALPVDGDKAAALLERETENKIS
jgi:hypothetical protein